MSDTLLKRDFSHKDIQRLRNLISGKTADPTGIQVGYQRSSKDHGDGVPFEENGKSWIYINGLKQNITKLDAIKKLSIIPLSCPICEGRLKTQHDKKMYNIHKMCLDCVIKFETKLKIEGKYDEYAKSLVNNNIDSFLKDYEEFLSDILRTSTMNGHISEEGLIEKWIGDGKEAVKQMQNQLEEYKKTR